MTSTQSNQEAYNQLAYYTLSLQDPSFIHQHIVDTYTAQNANDHTKPIAITFALVGLYLCVEKHFSGRQVQEMHTIMARHKTVWPEFPLPVNRGEITIHDVLLTSPGEDRNIMIQKWCVSVWDAYEKSHATVRELALQFIQNE